MYDNRKSAISRIVLAYLKEPAIPGMPPDKAAIIAQGPSLLKKVNENIAGKKKPFAGLDESQERILMAYTILRRENPILEKGNHPNYEAAVKALEEKAFDDKKALEERLVKQVNKLEGAVSKPLEFKKGKGITVSKDK